MEIVGHFTVSLIAVMLTLIGGRGVYGIVSYLVYLMDVFLSLSIGEFGYCSHRYDFWVDGSMEVYW